MYKFLGICFLLMISQPLISAGQNHAVLLNSKLDELHKNQLFNGSILIAKAGKVLYQRNLGYADIEHKVTINNNTEFEIASVTKSFTAVLILQLAEKGKIYLDSTVSYYIPELARKDLRSITVHHLLSHTSGIQDFVGLNCDFASWTKKDFMEGLDKTPVNFKPGTQFQYASSTYVLLKFIIEKVTGKSYEQNLKDHILTPAGMHHTGIIYNQAILDSRAMGYNYADGKLQNALPIASHEIFIGASSIYSTTADLLKFDRALYANKLLNEKSKMQMYTAVQPGYGYGWFIGEDPKRGKIVSHGGDVFGFTSLLERRLKGQVAIIVLSNFQDMDREQLVKLFDETILK